MWRVPHIPRVLVDAEPAAIITWLGEDAHLFSDTDLLQPAVAWYREKMYRRRNVAWQSFRTCSAAVQNLGLQGVISRKI